MSDDLSDGLRVARGHLGRAALETLDAGRVLLDSALRASGRESVGPDSLAGEIGLALDALVGALREGRPLALPPALSQPLAAALEAEIDRWERRSQTDSDARPVLRAFLGLRELLWEFGLRPADPATSGAENDPGLTAAAAKRPAGSAPRVQRFDVEG